MYLGEACVREHSNLADDMIPGARSSDVFQGCMQLLPHSDDPVCHALQLFLQTSIQTKISVCLAPRKRIFNCAVRNLTA